MLSGLSLDSRQCRGAVQLQRQELQGSCVVTDSDPRQSGGGKNESWIERPKAQQFSQ